MRIVNEDGALIGTCETRRSEQYLLAPNAVPIRKHNGQLVAIKLRSAGDDRGHLTEHHGGPNMTTRLESLEGRPKGSKSKPKAQ